MTREIDDVADILADFCNGLEALAVNLRRQIQTLMKHQKEGLIEEAFKILSWQQERGDRLKEYEVAYKNSNLPDKWQHVYNILKANNSVIFNPLKDDRWGHKYWIYPEKYQDRIYRMEK